MRSVLVRRLVVLLAVALITGNAHAWLSMTMDQPATPRHHHQFGEPSSHHGQQHQDKGLRCCCDNLGCVPAYTTIPDLSSMVQTDFGTTIRYGTQTVFLRGRALLPEPDPPRPSALT
jgi:hypothetical protein